MELTPACPLRCRGLVGLRGRLSILLTNPVISAPEGAGHGLVTRSFPMPELDEASIAMGEKLVRARRKSTAATKRRVWARGTRHEYRACRS